MNRVSLQRHLIPVLAGLAAFVLTAQERDFLAAYEIEEIREAQEPNVRLQKYLDFAEDRLDRLELVMAEDRAGRSALVHDLLEDYQRIIVALDVVADDALQREIDITEGMAETVVRESEMLARLRAIEESAPDDISRYEFVLGDAIFTTEDSIEISQEDLGDRAEELLARQRQEREARQAIRTPEELEEQRQKEAEAAAKAEATKSKEKGRRAPPTLRRPGDPEQVYPIEEPIREPANQ